MRDGALRPEIMDVWQENLDSEMAIIRDLIESYPYIGMDTEFPGVVARPIGQFNGTSDYHYQTLRCNVDLLKLIQLGITLCDASGRRPEGTCTWQFNFRFNLNEDMYAPESIELLQGSGLNFKQHEEHGINPNDFAELLVSSGLVLLDDVKWIAFQGGYDFGYILKLVSIVGLPAAEADFFDLVRIWFPCIYDVKYLMRSCKTLRGGLNDVAKDLGVMRHGKEHQAGSDSLLTAAVFFAMRSQFFDDSLDDSKYLNQVHGFNQGGGSAQQSVSVGDDPHALPSEPLIPTPTGPPGSHGSSRRGATGAGQRPHLGLGASEGSAGPFIGPRASSAVSIKNPRTASATQEGLLGALQGRVSSPAVQ